MSARTEMSAQELIAFFSERNIELDVDEGRISYRAPRGRIPERVLRSLREQKESVLEILRASGRTGSGIGRRPQDAPYQASFAQQRLRFLDQFEPGSGFYNIPAAVKLQGVLDVGALQRTVDEVLRRHEALRTTFALADGVPVQVIAPQLQLALQVRDLSGLGEDERGEQVRKLAAQEAQEPFDLQRGPLIRAGLLKPGVQRGRGVILAGVQSRGEVNHHQPGWATRKFNGVARLWLDVGTGETVARKETT